MATNPGMLYVTMQPRPDLSLDQFHEWYNNEHGPTRLRLPAIFSSGLRYRATDSLEPTFLAAYDVTSMSHLATETYTGLRANRSPREAETIGQVDVKRSFLDLVASKQSPLFAPIQDLTDEEAEGLVLVAVELALKDSSVAETELIKWFQEEHLGMLSKVPGWVRSRVLRTSRLEGADTVKLVALHEYTKENGLGGPEHKASMATPWREEVLVKYVAGTHRRTYSLFYVFGPAPRDLSHLYNLPAVKSFSTADGKTRTEAGPSGSITSYVTHTTDGLEMPYRLEGNSSPTAPTLAFSNSLLTSLHMWDALVSILKTQRPDLRILRYDARGRHASPATPATMGVLADDIATLLDALRIPRLHALVGVSMGGATTLAFALRHAGRLGRFVVCDCNAASSVANTAAWKERIALAESPAPSGDGGGEPGIRTLAAATVERWFHPATMSGKEGLVREMTDMVAANDVQGFRYSCQALWDYDLKDELRSCQVPGLLVVGDGDGKGALAKAMDGFKGLVGKDGVELKVVPGTGHLPMFEDATAFWESIKAFL